MTPPKNELSRQELSERLAAIVESSADAIIGETPDDIAMSWNRAAERIFGHSAAELVGQPFSRLVLVHPDDVVASAAVFEQATAGAPTIEFENRYRCKDGSYKWLSWRSVLAGETLYAAARDVTSDKATEAALRSSLKEKEVLLQEVHHRVKNNLQVVASLINMQLRKIERADIRYTLEDCQRRVLAIALIHEKLYQSEDYSRVPFYEYLCSLAANVFEMTGVSPADIKLVLDVETIPLAVDKAIPCGLIVNELISNALKHGFPNNRAGTVRVELAAQAGLLRLCVKDDGVGLPAGFKIKESQSLGLQLVSTLCEQLDATVEILARDGAGFCIRFALDD